MSERRWLYIHIHKTHAHTLYKQSFLSYKKKTYKKYAKELLRFYKKYKQIKAIIN